MIVSNIAYTVMTVGLVWLWARQGLGSVALASLYGDLASGLIAGAALLVGWLRRANQANGAGNQRRTIQMLKDGSARPGGDRAELHPVPWLAPSSRPLRILLVVNVGVEIGGAERSVRIIRDALRQRGHEVRVASTDAKLEGNPPFADLIIPQRPRAGITGLAARFWYQAAYRV